MEETKKPGGTLKTVITSLDSKETIIKDFAYSSSVGRATSNVDYYFSEYDNFVYFVDKENDICEVIFYKSRTAGYWTTMDDNIYKYRLDNSNRIA